MMSIRPRDAKGRFLNRETWELAYALAGEAVPSRVGKRNASAPLAIADIERLARQRTKVRVGKPLPKPRRAPSAAKPPAPEAAYPSGTEFELTARYKATGRGARSTLHMKIRVVLTSPMSDVQARSLLDRAVRTGVVSPGIEVAWIDWSRGMGGEGKGGGMKEGHYDDPDHNQLRAFYAPIMAGGNPRFAKVSDSERDL